MDWIHLVLDTEHSNEFSVPIKGIVFPKPAEGLGGVPVSVWILWRRKYILLLPQIKQRFIGRPAAVA